MKMLLTLTKIYLLSTFRVLNSTNRLSHYIKILMIGSLLIFICSSYLIMISRWIDPLTNYFTLMGSPWNLVSYAVGATSLFLLIFGFISILGTWHLSGEDAQLVTKPIKPWQILGAKVLFSWILQIPVTMLILFPILLSYGIKLNVPSPYWGYVMSFVILTPLPPILLGFCILIPIIRISDTLIQNKNLLRYCALALTMIMMLIFNVTSLYLQKHGIDWLSLNFDRYPLAKAAKLVAANPSSQKYFLNFVGIISITFGWLAGTCFVFSKWYVKSLSSFSVIVSVKSQNTNLQITHTSNKYSLARRLISREFHSLNRDSLLFISGPFLMILMPLTFLLLITLNAEQVQTIRNLIQDQPSVVGWLPLINSLLIPFISSTTAIAATSFSREGISILFLKTLPIAPWKLIKAKLTHAAFFDLLATIMIGAIGWWLFRLEWSAGLLSCVCGFILASLSSFLGLILDTFNPRLLWDNPYKSYKGNINSLISMMATWLLLVFSCKQLMSIESIELRLPLLTIIASTLYLLLFFLYKRSLPQIWVNRFL